jgi:hypothetical protein
MRLAKEALPNATPLTPEERVSINEFWLPLQMSPFDVKEKRDRLVLFALRKIQAIQLRIN